MKNLSKSPFSPLILCFLIITTLSYLPSSVHSDSIPLEGFVEAAQKAMDTATEQTKNLTGDVTNPLDHVDEAMKNATNSALDPIKNFAGTVINTTASTSNDTKNVMDSTVNDAIATLDGTKHDLEKGQACSSLQAPGLLALASAVAHGCFVSLLLL